jgi:type VI secretion system protein ImpG
MGYRLIQEYFTLPEKFLFLDIDGIGPIADLEDHDNQFEIVFGFKQMGQESIRVSGGNFRLNCTPIINLFEHDADPIEIDHTRTEYRVRPQGNKLQHFEIFSVDLVSGLERGSSALQLYHSFYNFRNHQEKETQGRGYYQARTKKSARPRLNDEEIEVYRINQLRESAVDYGTDQYITFVANDGLDARPGVETISIDLTCTNRHLAEKLNVNDICLGNDKSPEFATFRNITKPTYSISPPLDAGLHWRLISHLSLNYLSLIDVHAFRGLLELYNFQIFFNQQAARANENRVQGIVSIGSQPQEWIYRGSPIRGRAIHIDMDEDKFAGEGDMYLFASVIQDFFALYSSMNSFTSLTVRGTRRGEEYSWPRRLGQQQIL